ncbi:OsmC family protein [Kitasatospora sp. RB6PN24]|uniref:OsmC family protein n=1 Tax=Kitasatospora humi TaxID=2893891 RepID=UPI001E622ABA|nr:OsmC family protein [Kitasatospora humi]MCC9306102.1 OsmC family protein [Kitasatospora humi]
MLTDTISHQQSLLHTRAGRTIVVSRYPSGILAAEPGRVVLDTAVVPGDGAGAWASLTPVEARKLAGLLLQQATAVEGNAPRLTGRLEAVAVRDDIYAITARGHLLTVDQPVDHGGADSGPTPAELLVASLAGGVAHYAGRHLDHHQVPRDGLRVTADFTMATDRPARVRSVDLKLFVPNLPPERADSLLAVARFCTVHNTLIERPNVTVTLDGSPEQKPCE